MNTLRAAEHKLGTLLLRAVFSLLAVFAVCAAAGTVTSSPAYAFEGDLVATILDADGNVVNQIYVQEDEEDQEALARGWNAVQDWQTYRLETDWWTDSKGALGSGGAFDDGAIKFRRIGSTLDLNGHTVGDETPLYDESHRLMVVTNHKEGTTTITSSNGLGELRGGAWTGYAYGSAIRVENGDVEISNLKIVDSYHAGAIIDNGGSIYLGGGTTRIDNVHFDDCYGMGGDIYISGGTNTITNVTSVSAGNYAKDGGSIYIDGGTNTFENLSIDEAVIGFNSNIYFSKGGAIFIDGGTNTFTNVQISNCLIKSGDGAGVYVKSGTNTFTNLEVSNCTAKVTRSVVYPFEAYSYGGGVYVDSDATKTSFDGLTLTGNVADYGAGIYIKAKGITLNNVQIDGNTGITGGGIYIDAANVTINGGTVSNNTGSEQEGKGGGIYINNTGSTINNVTLSNNTVANDNGKGGGIYFAKSATLNNVTVKDCSAPLGGGIYVAADGSTFNTLMLTGNTADRGSALYVAGKNTTANNLTARGNRAEESAAVYVAASGFTLGGSRAEITNNGCAQAASSRTGDVMLGCAGIFIPYNYTMIVDTPIIKVSSNVDATGNASNLWLGYDATSSTEAKVAFYQNLSAGSLISARLTPDMIAGLAFSTTATDRTWTTMQDFVVADEAGWNIVEGTNNLIYQTSDDDPSAFEPAVPKLLTSRTYYDDLTSCLEVPYYDYNTAAGLESELVWRIVGTDTWQPAVRDSENPAYFTFTLTNDLTSEMSITFEVKAIVGDAESEVDVASLHIPAAKGVATMPQARVDAEYDANTQTGLEGGEHWVVVSGEPKALDSGIYTVVVAPEEGYVWKEDHSTTERTIEWTLFKRTLFAEVQSATCYLGDNFTPEVVVTGFCDAEPSWALTRIGYIAPTAPDVDTSVAGAVTVTPVGGHLPVVGGTFTNYQFEMIPGTITVLAISEADVPEIESITYIGSEIVGIPDTDAYTVVSGTSKATDAGTYSAEVQLKKGYAWADGTTGNKTVSWTIDKATLTASYAGETVQVGEEPTLAITISGFVGSDTEDSALTAFPSIDASGVDTSKVNEDGYTLTPKGGEAANYTFVYESGVLYVAGDHVSPVPTAEEGLTYQGALQTLLQAGDGYDIVAGDGYVLENGNALATDAGEYTVTVQLAEGFTSWADGNQDTQRTVTVTIDKAQLVVGVTDSEARMGETPNVQALLTFTGLVGSDTKESLLADAGTSAPQVIGYHGGAVTAADVTAGSCTLSVEVANATAANYEFVSNGATATLSFIPQTIEKPEAATGLVFNGTEQTAITGDHIVVSEGSATNAGTYRSTVTPEEGYAWEDGSTGAITLGWSIAKAQLTVTYAGETIACGGEPELAVTYDGFVGEDNATVLIAVPTVENPGAKVRTAGTYSLSPAGGQAANYELLYVAGDLVVSLPEVAVPAVEGGTDAQASGTLSGEAIQSLDDTLRLVVEESAADVRSNLESECGTTLKGVWDVTLLCNETPIHEGFGSFDLTLPSVDNAAGKAVTVWHKHFDGTLTSETVTADENGKVTVTVSDLSTFAISFEDDSDDGDDSGDPDDGDGGDDSGDGDDDSDDPSKPDDGDSDDDGDDSGDSGDSDNPSKPDDGKGGKDIPKTADTTPVAPVILITLVSCAAAAVFMSRRRKA